MPKPVRPRPISATSAPDGKGGQRSAPVEDGQQRLGTRCALICTLSVLVHRCLLPPPTRAHTHTTKARGPSHQTTSRSLQLTALVGQP